MIREHPGSQDQRAIHLSGATFARSDEIQVHAGAIQSPINTGSADAVVVQIMSAAATASRTLAAGSTEICKRADNNPATRAASSNDRPHRRFTRASLRTCDSASMCA